MNNNFNSIFVKNLSKKKKKPRHATRNTMKMLQETNKNQYV